MFGLGVWIVWVCTLMFTWIWYFGWVWGGFPD